MTDVQRIYLLLPLGEVADGDAWQLGREWLVVWIAVLAILLTVAWYVIDKIRPKPEKKEPLASEWLSKYRDLHSRGVLSDEEFRTIKTTLNKQLQDELKANDEND
jgi:hypothetical protein